MRALFCFALLLLTAPASAHEWYAHKKDPVYRYPCCGGQDCNTWAIAPGNIKAERDGYRVTLTLEEARKINPSTLYPVDGLVSWARVQPSEDGNWHLCIMTSSRTDLLQGIYCLFAPPNT